ncbi:hypothetical protein IV203_016206 [Nitzschia inconspicua]|uniref:Uncharacterized protein n=1 Tax=Nitzschia inconspicua TaxID=303405 RepID=A0A9K3PI13_9STRA|nr:hypothetical protein IV203_016206 [Nitzschia inconspicua]
MDTLFSEDISFPIIMPGHQVFVEDEDFVVGQWKRSLEEEKNCDDTDGGDDRMSMGDILEIDRQIGYRFLDVELFGGAPCESPIGPMEELLHLDKDEHGQFLTPFLPDDFMSDSEDDDSSMMEGETDTFSLSFDERYKATLQKLAYSMQKSQETRMSLTMKTTKTEKYHRLASVKKILSSVASSSDQVQNYVTSLQRHS